MCYFCHAQLFEITYAENIKSPLVQHSCRNAKVVEVFCDAGCRLSTRCRPSIHRPPVDALRVPAEMPIALSWAPLHADIHVVRCCGRAHHREQRLLPATAQLPATSCLGAFWSPVPSARGQSRHPGDQKPAQERPSPLPSSRRAVRLKWVSPREDALASHSTALFSLQERRALPARAPLLDHPGCGCI